MPGVVTFLNPKVNIEGDLLGTLTLDSQGRLAGVTPLSGLTDGEWVEVKGYDKIGIDLIPSATATFKVCGSMAVAKPANDTHGYQVVVDKELTAEEIVAITTPLRWLKVRVTANTGTVMAPFIGVKGT